jgi:hypothetical protein
MKKSLALLVFIAIIRVFPVEIFAWEGMPTPPLHVEGNKLKDPTGKDVLLHGWMQPTASWFNGGGRWYIDPSDWNNPDNIAGFLNFMNDVATLMSDTSPRYGQNHGWYASFVRVNTDAVGGWTSESGLIDTSQFDGWINNFLVPYAEHLSSRGLYLVLSATGPMVVNVDGDGARNTSQGTQSRLLTFWERVANAPGVKNADNIMFELMNEPVQIESSPGNGDWGFGSVTYFEAFTEWLQPIIDSIRNTGANNVIWVPTLEWQGSPHQWDQFPFSGTNIGVACHYYPAYGGVFDDITAVQSLWDRQYKPAADRWPMIITEMFWTPYPNDPWNLVNGSTAGFGNAIRNAMDNQGNVSYLVGFIGDLLESLNDNLPDDCYLSPREGAQSYFLWLPEYTWAAPDEGTPEYEYASVTDNNPKQILVIISKPLLESDNYDGFTVKVDSQVVEIDSVVIGDSTNQLVINLSDSILNDNEIVFSYSNGNVVSIYEKNLVNFNDTLVDNLLKGASPRITELKTNEDGDTLIAKFNMKMQLPTDFSALTLNAEYNGDMSFPVLQNSFIDNDSTLLLFSLADRVYGDYHLLLSYSGNNIISSDSGLLKTFTDFPVTNNSQGLPVHIDSGRVESDGISVVLEFSKPLAIAVGQSASFTLKVNGTGVSFENLFVLNNTIRFTLLKNLYYDDIVTANYTPGNITATDRGMLEGFSGFLLTNLINIPEWISIPNKIEAENYYLQSGIQTEQTGDTGGGLNVGWIDTGDWLEYAIENNTAETSYEITFRIASPNSGRSLDYYLDNTRIGGVSVPNTGGWQTWQSVVGELTAGQGKHYFKVVATTGGFNINYYDIKNIETEIRMLNNDDIKIYPNPVSNEMIIRSVDFRFNKVEIIDIMGNTVLLKLTVYKSELHMPVNLSNGMYIVKISNEKQSQLKKIIINSN